MSNPQLLKAKLQIKRQLKYVTAEFEKASTKYPNNEAGINFWEGMMEAYKIALQHINGGEV